MVMHSILKLPDADVQNAAAPSQWAHQWEAIWGGRRDFGLGLVCLCLEVFVLVPLRENTKGKSNEKKVMSSQID